MIVYLNYIGCPSNFQADVQAGSFETLYEYYWRYAYSNGIIEHLSLPYLIKDFETESVLLSLFRHNFQIFSLEKIRPSNHKVGN